MSKKSDEDNKTTSPDDGEKEQKTAAQSAEVAAASDANGKSSERPLRSSSTDSDASGVPDNASESFSTPAKMGSQPSQPTIDMSPYVNPWNITTGYPPSPWDPTAMMAPYPPPPPGYPGFAGPPPAFWSPMPPVPIPTQPQNGVKLSAKQSRALSDRRGATSPSEIEDLQRRDVEHMGCTCKKTRCLKLYCQCYSVQIDCNPTVCRCQDCHNVPEHETTRNKARRIILLRNPKAFGSKFKKDEKTLAHRVGCKCRKSGCLKKYCECFAGSVTCTESCRCTGCKNRKGNTPAAAAAVQNANNNFVYRGGPFPSPGPMMQPMGMGMGDPTQMSQPYTAAQSLAFLKHAPSPDEKERKPKKPRTDPVEERDPIEMVAAMESDPEAMDSLMMAAYAMTEFGQGSSPSKARLSPKKTAAAAAKIVEAPTPAKKKA